MTHPQLSLRDILTKSTHDLHQKQVDSPRLSAELVVAHALGMNRLDLFLDPDMPLVENDLARIRPFLMRRGSGEPMAYILGQREFYGLDFFVSPDVLIPRPDSELGIDLALKLFNPAQAMHFVDVGTGSGALAVTLLKRFPNALAVATDISSQALCVAQKNAERHGVKSRLLLTKGNLLDHFAVSCVDLIIANLPYVSERESETLNHEVVAFEPHLAIFGGLQGDELFQPLLAKAIRVLKCGGRLLLEIGASQAETIAGMIRDSSTDWSSITVHKDLSGMNRYVHARWLEDQ